VSIADRFQISFPQQEISSLASVSVVILTPWGRLPVQACSNGTGLGAWLTKMLMNPHTERIALARILRVAWNFLQNTHASHLPSEEGSALQGSWDEQLVKVLRHDLFSSVTQIAQLSGCTPVRGGGVP
jgi:hypothetical protein